jgi:AcrR family transcriptional regulator
VRPLRRDAAENRERLLTAAALVFAEYGLDAGVEEIARVAGVGMGTLYRRFPSKQALIDELIGGLRRDLLDIARAASTRTDGTGLEQLLFATGRLQAAQPGCLQRLWAHSEAGLDAVQEIRRLIEKLLRSAQTHGRVRAEITSTDVTMVLWSVSAMIETTGAVAPKAWRRHLELVLAGLRPVDRKHLASELTEAPLTRAQVRRLSSPAR